MWLVQKALYGLRESPKLWGDYRDIEISQMSFQANFITYEYQQSFAEENLWLVRRKDAGDGDQVEGLALVYVDDVMLFGTREIVEGGLQSFRRTWETSEPTWVGDREPVRYCGMELSRTEQGDFFFQSMFLLEGSGSATWHGGPLQRSDDEGIPGTRG